MIALLPCDATSRCTKRDAPGDYGEIGEERFRLPTEAPTQDARWLTNVTRPTITLYRPEKEQNTGTAMLVCVRFFWGTRLTIEALCFMIDFIEALCAP